MLAAPTLIATIVLAGCTTPRPPEPVRLFPSPESYLPGKKLDSVAQVYGNPSKVNTVANTTFVNYTGYGRRGYGYDNICFLELRVDRESGVIHSATVGSNLGIDNPRWGFDVKQDCNKVLFNERLAQ